MALAFHWRLLRGGERTVGSRSRAFGDTHPATGLPDLDNQLDFCRRAEDLGIDGLLVDIGAVNPAPLLLASALGLGTSHILFIVACRSGLWHPTTFVQQLNTLSALIGGRVSVNVVAGHSPAEQRFYGDFLAHNERYSRTKEFLAICHALWRDDGPVSYRGTYYRMDSGRLNTPFSGPRPFPELFIAGGSGEARDLAVSQGTCWMRMADTPENVHREARPVLEAGKQVGLRLSVICRTTRAQAMAAAQAMIRDLDPDAREFEQQREFVAGSDSVSIKQAFDIAGQHEWLTPYLWTGAVRSHGAPTMALIGSFQDVATAILEYRDAGVSQFILSGWPKLEEMELFGTHVIPLVRAAERETAPMAPSPVTESS